LTLVRRKWSGHEVPNSPSGASFSRERNSSTASLSVKCPTCGLSVQARPRIVGKIAAALARRSASGSGS
jgi:hypothetical protein